MRNKNVEHLVKEVVKQFVEQFVKQFVKQVVSTFHKRKTLCGSQNVVSSSKKEYLAIERIQLCTRLLVSLVVVQDLW